MYIYIYKQKNNNSSSTHARANNLQPSADLAVGETFPVRLVILEEPSQFVIHHILGRLGAFLQFFCKRDIHNALPRIVVLKGSRSYGAAAFHLPLSHVGGPGNCTG